MGCSSSVMVPLHLPSPEILIGHVDFDAPPQVEFEQEADPSMHEQQEHVDERQVSSQPMPQSLLLPMQTTPSARSNPSSTVVTTGTTASRRSTRSSASSGSMMSPGDGSGALRWRQTVLPEDQYGTRIPRPPSDVPSPLDEMRRFGSGGHGAAVGGALNNGHVVRDASSPAADARIIHWLGSGETVLSSVESPTLPTGPGIQVDARIGDRTCGLAQQQLLASKTPKTPLEFQVEAPRTTPPDSDIWPSFTATTPRQRGGPPNNLFGSASGYGAAVQAGSASGYNAIGPFGSASAYNAAVGMQSSRRSVTFEEDGVAMGQQLRMEGQQQRRRIFSNVAVVPLATSFDGKSPSPGLLAPTHSSGQNNNSNGGPAGRSTARPNLTIIPFRSPLDGPAAGTSPPRGTLAGLTNGVGERRFPRSAAVSRRSSVTSSHGGLFSPVQSLHLESRTESFATQSQQRVDSLFRSEVVEPVGVDDGTWVMMETGGRTVSTQLDEEQGLADGVEPLYYQESPRQSPVNQGALSPAAAIT